MQAGRPPIGGNSLKLFLATTNLERSYRGKENGNVHPQHFGFDDGVLGLFAFPAGAVFAEKPIPNGKDAYTNVQLDKEMHAYLLYQSNLYEKHTQDPPEVRKTATAFSADVFKRATGTPRRAVLERTGKTGGGSLLAERRIRTFSRKRVTSRIIWKSPPRPRRFLKPRWRNFPVPVIRPAENAGRITCCVQF